MFASAVAAAVVASLMSLRTTFRLRFFELLVDSAMVAVVDAGDRVGELIAVRCCCCGIAGERILSVVFTLVGVLDGVVVAIVGVRTVAVPSVDSKRRFFGVTTSSDSKPTSSSLLFFFFVVDDGDESWFVLSCSGRRSGFGLFILLFRNKGRGDGNNMMSHTGGRR